jgi:hypothetical protein
LHEDETPQEVEMAVCCPPREVGVPFDINTMESQLQHAVD